ncbi:MAG TPA: hypothetical protein PKD37_02645 [Oligoflexia bacterium]|nr:hypothetical protein [Oligoflexia bacterium]HMP26869.1 hypothetical protein [Oligoflexia bacterium]
MKDKLLIVLATLLFLSLSISAFATPYLGGSVSTSVIGKAGYAPKVAFDGEKIYLLVVDNTMNVKMLTKEVLSTTWKQTTIGTMEFSDSSERRNTRLVIDPSGWGCAAWHGTPNKAVVAVKSPDGGFANGVAIGSLATVSGLASDIDCAVNGSGEVFAVWRTQGEIFANFRDSAGNWSTEAKIENAIDRSYSVGQYDQTVAALISNDGVRQALWLDRASTSPDRFVIYKAVALNAQPSGSSPATTPPVRILSPFTLSKDGSNGEYAMTLIKNDEIDQEINPISAGISLIGGDPFAASLSGLSSKRRELPASLKIGGAVSGEKFAFANFKGTTAEPLLVALEGDRGFEFNVQSDGFQIPNGKFYGNSLARGGSNEALIAIVNEKINTSTSSKLLISVYILGDGETRITKKLALFEDINPETASPIFPAVAMSNSGKGVIVYRSPQDGVIKSHDYDPTGVPELEPTPTPVPPPAAELTLEAKNNLLEIALLLKKLRAARTASQRQQYKNRAKLIDQKIKLARSKIRIYEHLLLLNGRLPTFRKRYLGAISKFRLAKQRHASGSPAGNQMRQAAIMLLIPD